MHDIRLAAGFEISAHPAAKRTLSRAQAETLAQALAADLARSIPGIDQSMLVLGGGLFEPAQLLRPGLPAWSALFDLARPVLRDQGLGPRLLAIGSHDGRMPDQRLAPPNEALQSQFVLIPLLLVSSAEDGPNLESELERELFERGSIDPPARALLHETLGLDTVHGQLLTASDVLALQNVQMDAAGLGSFWPVVEHAVLSPDQDADFSLPAELRSRWKGAEQALEIDFVTFNRYRRPPAEYALWQRAFRTLTALVEAHALPWHAAQDTAMEPDGTGRLLLEPAGRHNGPEAVTEHRDRDAGLIAWTVAADSKLFHLYPLDADSARRKRAELERQYGHIHRADSIQHCPENLQLRLHTLS